MTDVSAGRPMTYDELLQALIAANKRIKELEAIIDKHYLEHSVTTPVSITPITMILPEPPK